MNKSFRNILGSIINNYSPFGRFLKKIGLGTDLASAMENVLKYYTHSGMSDDKREEMAEQDEYLDENREQDYAITKRGWEEMFSPEATIKSQAAGLDAVGINRMALAGNVSSGASASTPSPSQPSSHGSSGDPISALMSIIGGAAQIKDLGASADLKRSQARHQDIVNKWEDKQQEARYINMVANTRNLEANLPKIVADSHVAQSYALYAPQLFETQVAQNVANAQKALADADKARADVKLDEAQVRELNEKCKNHQKERQQMDALIEKIQQECITLSTQAYLNDELVQESMARVEKYKKQIEEIGVNMGLTQKEIDYYSWNHAHVVSTKNPVATIHKEIYPTDNLPGTPGAGD